jgi:hypothetical protein
MALYTRRSVPVIVQIRDSLEWLIGMRPAEGDIVLLSLPNNLDTVTIGSTVYTFKTTSTSAITDVQIASNIFGTITNLAAAIEATYAASQPVGQSIDGPLGVRAQTALFATGDVTAGDEPIDGVLLTASRLGTVGNAITVSASGDTAYEGMDGGVDGGVVVTTT